MNEVPDPFDAESRRAASSVEISQRMQREGTRLLQEREDLVAAEARALQQMGLSEAELRQPILPRQEREAELTVLREQIAEEGACFEPCLLWAENPTPSSLEASPSQVPVGIDFRVNEMSVSPEVYFELRDEWNVLLDGLNDGLDA